MRPRERFDPDDDEFVVRPARRDDAFTLAELCTDTFFGSHKLSDGPIIFLQRLFIWTKVLRQVMRRLAIEEDGRECRLLVAVDGAGEGEVRACCDIAIHLFDKELKRFELMVDEFPSGREARRRYGWRPYVASMAVAAGNRRRGLGRRMLVEAERLARSWGYRELMLEVAVENDAARAFYMRQGYSTWSRSGDSSGAGATAVRVRGFYWQVEQVDKCLMGKVLPAAS